MPANTFSETRYKEVSTLARQLQITAIVLPVAYDQARPMGWATLAAAIGANL
jgi:hypothetical protein